MKGRTGRGWRWAMVAALLTALVVTTVVGRSIWTQQHPPEVAEVGVGELFVVDGVSYTVTRFDRVTTLPPEEADGEPVRPPDGAEIVVVELEIIGPDPTMLAENYCDFSLSNAEQVTWRPDFDWTYGADLPQNRSCASPDTSDDAPWPAGQPYPAVATFVVPTTMIDGLEFEISWTEPDRRVTVRS